MTDFNVKLLRNLVIWARGEHKRLDKKFRKLGKYEWDQESWAQQEKNGVCKTAFCMAGAAVMSSGYKIAWDSWFHDYGDISTREATYCYPKDGNKHDSQELSSISETARMLLGIDQFESEKLFDGGNTISDIESIAREICERRGKKLKV